MRRAAALLLVAAIAIAGVAGCKEQNDAKSALPRPSKAFCKAAARYDEHVTTAKLKLSKQIEMVSAIAANAPKDIEREAQTFLDALKKREAGDMSVVDNPKVQDAADRVNRRAGQDCGWYQREGM
jgi:ABC-type phosphate/phosphonate transport system substrate-binding protein